MRTTRAVPGSISARRAAIGAACLAVLSACGSTVLDTTTSLPAEPTTTSSTPTTTTTTSHSDSRRVFEIPAGNRAAIDGILEAGEWDGSASTTMSDGSLIHAMYNGATLYVAFETGTIGAPNLAIATDEEIWVLHSSAALGSALYLPGDAAWELSHGFVWCCRNSSDSSARQSLLESEGWQANIGFAGDVGVVEFQVELPWNGARVAASYVTESAAPAFWPTDLSADAQDQLTGARHSDIDFRHNEWFTAVPIG